MTAPGRYSAGDGSFNKSAGSAAARGGVLIAVAVVLGLIILAVAYDGGDDGAAVAADDDVAGTDTPPPSLPLAGNSGDTGDTGDSGDDDDGDDTTTTTATDVAPTTHPPGEVKVAVVNGVGTDGIAGIAAETLGTAGYVTSAEDAANSETLESVIYYVEGYSEDAKAVAAVFGAAAVAIQGAPADVLALVLDTEGIEDFHIFAIQGQDGQLG